MASNEFEPVPVHLETVLDPAWLAWALDDLIAGDEILDVQKVGSSRTLASKTRFRVLVQGDDGVQREHAFCIKAHFEDEGGDTLGSEARFYRDLATRVAIRTPRAYYTGLDEDAGRSLIIMDDLVAEGAHFLSGLSPYSIDTVRQTLGQLARLHASTWHVQEIMGLDWLASRLWGLGVSVPNEVLQILLDDGRGPNVAPGLRDAGVVKAAFLKTAETGRTCLIHGDAHSGNSYIDRAGQAGFLDWQIVQVGHWATDVSYHIATTLDVEDRRAYERELILHYLDCLASMGVEPPPMGEAWDAYTLHFSYGYFLWAITRISDRAVVEVHIPRLAAAITDHRTFERLGVC